VEHEPSNRSPQHPRAGRTRRVVEFAFGTLARLRSGRAVHTRGTVRALREWAYTGSRRGRGADPATVSSQPGDTGRGSV
jgi:hypothetical protein